MDNNRRAKLLRIAAISFKAIRQEATSDDMRERRRLLFELRMKLAKALEEAEQITLERM